MPDTNDSQPLIPTRVIGVLGGVGSGKTELAAALESAGAARFDADLVARDQLSIPEVQQTIVEWWGDDVLDSDSNIDTQALATIIFADPRARTQLEELIHPRVRELMHGAIRQANAQQIPAIVLDIPLLYEAKLDTLCNVVLFLDTPQEARIERAGIDRGWDADEVNRREAAQITLEEKRRRANVVFPNQGSLKELRDRVETWYNEWIASPLEPIEEHS